METHGRSDESPFPAAPPTAWPAVVSSPVPGPGASSEPPRRSLGGGWFIIALALVFAAIVTYGLGWALEREGQRLSGRANDNPPPTSETTVPPVDGRRLASMLDDLITFVEQDRGHEFLARPVVRSASDQEFEELMRTYLSANSDQFEAQATRAELMGVTGAADWRASLEPLEVDLADAGLDPATGEILVRSGSAEEADAFVRAQVVRLLALELDTQLLGWSAPAVATVPTEEEYGREALRAGSAERIVDDYRDSFTVAEQAEYEAGLSARSGLVASSGSTALSSYADLARRSGRAIAVEAVAERGIAGLDRLLQRPPTSSAQVIEDGLGDPRPIIDLAPPPTEGPATSAGRMGAAELVVIFGLLGGDPGEVTRLWAGGSFATWTGDRGDCISVRVAPAAAVDLPDLLAALTELSAVAEADATLGADTVDPSVGLVEVTRCA